MLYLTESDVQRFLPMRDCIEALGSAFARLASGEALNQPRCRLVLPTRSALHYMAAADGRYFGTKIYSTNPRHGAHFFFLLYRSEDAVPLALMEANYLGQIRTGAASGLATSLLARSDSRTQGIIGSGFQARSQLEAVLAVRKLERTLVWSRSPEKRERFARECSDQLSTRVEAVSSAEEAVRGADIVTTATNAKEPVLESEWVADGAHVNATGSNYANRREIPASLVGRASLIVVDNREQARLEAGDLVMALKDEDWGRTVELQEVVAGSCGRTNPGQITLFESIGLAVEDVAAAALVYERAVEGGAGRSW
jgi:ornithine cyclodeaminase/alanine dehydrogenase-like protein (mu-crystallin family)